MTRTVRVLADYECHPLWLSDERNYRNIPPGVLPISDALAGSLIEWAHEYDRTLNHEDPSSSGFAEATEQRLFVDKGRELSVRLQSELGKPWNVVYYDQLLKRDVDVED